MYICKNKSLYVLNEAGDSYEQFTTVDNEIFLTADFESIEVFNPYGSHYKNAVLSPISKRIARVYILNKDETLHRDISEYVSEWDINFEYKQGGIRSGSLTIMNFNNEWNPSPVKDTIWKGTKFRIYVGLYYDEVIYWKDCGITVCGNISVDTDNKTLSIPLHDKFALLDGTVGGKKNYSFKIPVNTNVRAALTSCLSETKINGASERYDTKSVIFPTSLFDKKTPYTINKDPNGNMGEICIELADMLSLDIYYNFNGNLTLEKGATTNDDLANKSVLWAYEDNKGQYSDVSFDIDFDSLVNEVEVVGAIEAGKQYKGTATNTSAKSQANIYMTEPNPLQIDDSNIIGDNNCLNRAKYELIKQGRLGVKLKFKSMFIPHLELNKLILFNNAELGFVNEKFIINSISMDSNMDMSLTVSSVNEVTF